MLKHCKNKIAELTDSTKELETEISKFKRSSDFFVKILRNVTWLHYDSNKMMDFKIYAIAINKIGSIEEG